MATLKNTTINDTGFLELPQGTTAQRPSSPQAGMIRYNTDIRDTEFYDGTDWKAISEVHPEATGGQVVETDIAGKTYRIHYFTDTGDTNFTVNKGGEVEYLIVGGGGGGGSSPNNNNDGCGGGGGGGVLRGFTTVTPQTYTITVGAGGSGVNSSLTPGGDGGDSRAFGLTAIGGGGGATQNTAGRAGGSGGGAGNGGGTGPYPGGAGTSGQGFPGGIITTGSNNWVGSGGGGAGGPGISGDQGTQSQGFGGRGIGSLITGKLEHFGGGGGGGCAGGRLGGGGGTSHTSPYTAPRGGIGGGATGGYERNKAPSGEKNTGGGGGGGTGNTSAWGGDGGSGIVIVRYEKNSQDATSFNRKQLSVQPKITTIHQNNIVMNLDAGDLRSYPGSGNTWFDLSSRGNNGTRVNNPTWYDAHGGFFRFNGSNQYIDLVSQDDAQSAMPGSYTPMTGAGTNNFSIEVWFRTSQNTGNNVYTAPHLVGRDNGDIYANLTVVNGRFTWTYYNGSWQGTQSSTNVSNGRWYHGVWANKSNNGDLFINGVKEVSNGQANTNSGNFFSPDSIARGYSGSTGYFEGDIAVVRFYSKTLDEGEVRQNFNALRGRFGV